MVFTSLDYTLRQRSVEAIFVDGFSKTECPASHEIADHNFYSKDIYYKRICECVAAKDCRCKKPANGIDRQIVKKQEQRKLKSQGS